LRNNSGLDRELKDGKNEAMAAAQELGSSIDLRTSAPPNVLAMSCKARLVVSP